MARTSADASLDDDGAREILALGDARQRRADQADADQRQAVEERRRRAERPSPSTTRGASFTKSRERGDDEAVGFLRADGQPQTLRQEIGLDRAQDEAACSRGKRPPRALQPHP